MTFDILMTSHYILLYIQLSLKAPTKVNFTIHYISMIKERSFFAWGKIHHHEKERITHKKWLWTLENFLIVHENLFLFFWINFYSLFCGSEKNDLWLLESWPFIIFYCFASIFKKKEVKSTIDHKIFFTEKGIRFCRAQVKEKSWN